MLSVLASKHCFLFLALLLSCLFVSLAPICQVQAKTAHKTVSNKYCLVPPPPPYVPSMLPEMSQNKGYWRNYYSSYGQSHTGSAHTFKPNKYITYCVPNKT